MANHSRSPVAVSVIIVNYNAGSRLRRCLEHLAAQTFRDFEVIIVDNASSDGSVEEARGSNVEFLLIEAGDNLGFAAANNRAAKEARGEWLALLNPDAYAAPDWLEQLCAAAQRCAGTDAFGSTQINADDRRLIDGAGDVYHAFGVSYRGGFGWPVEQLPPEGECFAPCAAAALIRKQAFLTLDGFYEPFFCYAEDIDFGFRLRLQGGRCVQVREARVYHEGSGVTGRKSDFTVYHGHRNRIWVYYLNMPFALLIVTLPFHLATNVWLLLSMIADGTGRAYIRALWDAHKGLPVVFRERCRRQQMRTASTVAVGCALTWSPFEVLKRSPNLRPIKKKQHRVTVSLK